MAPVFGEGGNLPTRFFELDREMLKREGFDFEKFAKKVRRSSIIQNQLVTSQAMQDTVTSRELFERMPTRPALAEPEVAAHKVRSYEDDSTDWAPSGGRAAAPEQPAQPARRRPVRSTRNRDPVYTGQKTIGGTAPKRSAPWTWLASAGLAMSSNRSSVPTRTSGADRLGAVPPMVFCPV